MLSRSWQTAALLYQKELFTIFIAKAFWNSRHSREFSNHNKNALSSRKGQSSSIFTKKRVNSFRSEFLAVGNLITVIFKPVWWISHPVLCVHESFLQEVINLNGFFKSWSLFSAAVHTVVCRLLFSQPKSAILSSDMCLFFPKRVRENISQ
jgi:hypothetical protein